MTAPPLQPRPEKWLHSSPPPEKCLPPPRKNGSLAATPLKNGYIAVPLLRKADNKVGFPLIYSKITSS